VGTTAVELHQARLRPVRAQADLVVRPGLHLHQLAMHRQPQRDWGWVLGTECRFDIDSHRPVAGIGEHFGDSGLGGIVIRAVDQLNPELLEQLEARPVLLEAAEMRKDLGAVLA
jgi:hypothetical protein